MQRYPYGVGDYAPRRGSRGSWVPPPQQRSGHHSMARDSRRAPPNNNQAWVTRVEPGDPRLQTGIRYHPETDNFVIPSGKNAGPFIGPCEVAGREFIRRYPQGSAADLRRRRLDEYRMTGRLEVRPRDRFGNPWPADRGRESSRRENGARRQGGMRPGKDAYEVEFPNIPEEDEVMRAPLLLTQHAHWEAKSSRMSSKHSSRAPSRMSN